MAKSKSRKAAAAAETPPAQLAAPPAATVEQPAPAPLPPQDDTTAAHPHDEHIDPPAPIDPNVCGEHGTAGCNCDVAPETYAQFCAHLSSACSNWWHTMPEVARQRLYAEMRLANVGAADVAPPNWPASEASAKYAVHTLDGAMTAVASGEVVLDGLHPDALDVNPELIRAIPPDVILAAYNAHLDAWINFNADQLQLPVKAAPENKPAPNVNIPAGGINAAAAARCKETLAQLGRVCRSISERNYDCARLTRSYVLDYLELEPGKTKRTSAIARVIDKIGEYDDAALAMDAKAATAYLRRKVDCWLHTAGACLAIGDGRGVAKGDGTVAGKGQGRADRPLPWTTMCELRFLVTRQGEGEAGRDEYSETWIAYPSIETEAKQLVETVARSGMARADVRTEVAKLRLKDAEMELAAAEREGKAGRILTARAAVAKWRKSAGLEPPVVKEPAAPAAAPAAPVKEPPVKDAPALVTSPQLQAADAAIEAGDDQDDETEASETAAPQAAAPAPPGECRAAAVQLGSESGSAKDVATSLLSRIVSHVAPDDVVIALSQLIAESADFSRAVKDAFADTYLILAERFQAPPVPTEQTSATLIGEFNAIVEAAVIDALEQCGPPELVGPPADLQAAA